MQTKKRDQLLNWSSEDEDFSCIECRKMVEVYLMKHNILKHSEMDRNHILPERLYLLFLPSVSGKDSLSEQSESCDSKLVRSRSRDY